MCVCNWAHSLPLPALQVLSDIAMCLQSSYMGFIVWVLWWKQCTHSVNLQAGVEKRIRWCLSALPWFWCIGFFQTSVVSEVKLVRVEKTWAGACQNSPMTWIVLGWSDCFRPDISCMGGIAWWWDVCKHTLDLYSNQQSILHGHIAHILLVSAYWTTNFWLAIADGLWDSNLPHSPEDCLVHTVTIWRESQWKVLDSVHIPCPLSQVTLTPLQLWLQHS